MVWGFGRPNFEGPNSTRTRIGSTLDSTNSKSKNSSTEWNAYGSGAMGFKVAGFSV